ncbi:hypothetical protein WJX84_010975 [Apatococcus fuscideae]|uniref:Uncharacterized protein n=1 Tax=Apatococcus fuscideae TaxID=2026836 RepID=A0AAW1SIU8_9CHLO
MASWTLLQNNSGSLGEQSRSAAVHLGTARPQQQVKASRCTHQCKRRRTLQVHASAAGAASSGEDPYKVLGLSQGAPADAFDRAYKRKRAENKFNEKELERIEAAHSTLMMSALSARLKGGATSDVSKQVKFADRPAFFPWRPRRYNAEKRIMSGTGVAYALLAAWGLMLPLTAGTRPVIGASVIGCIANLYKLNQIFPSGGKYGATDREKKQGTSNLIRGICLALGATFLGCALTFTIPDAIANALNVAMPIWFYESERSLIAVGAATANFIMTAFFR